jgi:hypothetical protein
MDKKVAGRTAVASRLHIATLLIILLKVPIYLLSFKIHSTFSFICNDKNFFSFCANFTRDLSICDNSSNIFKILLMSRLFDCYVSIALQRSLSYILIIVRISQSIMHDGLSSRRTGVTSKSQRHKHIGHTNIYLP